MCACANLSQSKDSREKYHQSKNTPKLKAYLGVRWCQTLPAVDSDQGVLLHRDVELKEAWLLQVQLGAPEHPRRDALADSLPDVDLSRVDGAVLLVEHAALPCRKHGRISREAKLAQMKPCSVNQPQLIDTRSSLNTNKFLVLSVFFFLFLIFFYCNLNATGK